MKKRFYLAPFGAIAALLAITSVAFACTAFLGTFTVRGNCQGPGNPLNGCDKASQSVTATGLDISAHTYNGPGNTWTMNQTVDGNIARATANGGSVTISTGVAPNGSKLWNTDPDGNPVLYDINYYNSNSAAHTHAPTPLGTVHVGGPGYEDHSNWHSDCMSSFVNDVNQQQDAVTAPGTVKIGTVTVDGNGVAQGNTAQRTFVLPPSAADSGAEESAVCISDPQAYWGNQAPITIVG